MPYLSLVGASLHARRYAAARYVVSRCVEFVSLDALGAGIGLLFAWLSGEYGGAAWFAVLTLIATFPVAALLWWARVEMEKAA